LRYASLLGKRPILDPGTTPGEGVGNLYHELDKMVGESINVNIETERDRLVFRLWDTYNWEGYNLLWLPVRFVEKLRIPLRRLAISFLNLIHKAGRFNTITNCDDMDMVMDWYRDVGEWPEDERDNLSELMHSYEEGRIHKLMERIKRRSYHSDLRVALADFVPQGVYESELVALMTEGLDVFGYGKPNIFRYCYHPFYDETNDDLPVTPDTTIMMIYSEDFLTNSLRETLNEQAGNYGEIVPCATLTLRPDGDTIFGKEDYPGIFFGYMSKLLDFLYTNQFP
jgi:hypothetical protein